jgi:hypothetical protein
MLVRVVCVLGLVSLVAGCGDDDKRGLPYSAGQTAVIGSGSGECVKLDDECIDGSDLDLEQCAPDEAMDVLVDADGNAIDVICYPTTGVAIETFDGPVEDVGNNVVLVIDDADDGVDVDGDVTIDGNNVSLYGHGPDTSVIGGDLNIDKNNATVRGVRVTGDVTIDKNNPSIVDCVIEGDLLIRGNNVSIAECEVWGTLTIEGNNAILVSNVFATPPVVKGMNTVCTDNVAFTDANGDAHVDDDELGDPVECGTSTVEEMAIDGGKNADDKKGSSL